MMESNLLMERLHFVKGVDPVANAFAGATVTSAVINMKEYDRVMFVLYKGVGGVGTTVVTALACSNASATSTTAIRFYYRRCCATTDVEEAYTYAAVGGFTTTAAASEFYLIEVKAEDLIASGYHYVEINCAEAAADPVIGCILAITSGPRYQPGVKHTAIV